MENPAVFEGSFMMVVVPYNAVLQSNGRRDRRGQPEK